MQASAQIQSSVTSCMSNSVSSINTAVISSPARWIWIIFYLCTNAVREAERQSSRGSEERSDEPLACNDLLGTARQQTISPETSQIISIAITTLCLCLSLLKASPILFIQPYFLFRSLCPSAAPRSSSIRAFASTHSPFGLPRTSHGTILTFRLWRILFTFPAFASEYMYNVPCASANH